MCARVTDSSLSLSLRYARSSMHRFVRGYGIHPVDIVFYASIFQPGVSSGASPFLYGGKEN